MAVVLLKLIFLIITTFSNVITRVIFNVAAHVLVQMVQALKVSGDGSQRLIEQVRNAIETCLNYISEFIIEAISTLFSYLLDFIKEGVFSSSFGLVGALAGLVEKSRTSLNDVVQEIPEVLNAFTEMVGKIASDLLNNCYDAISYVMENALS